MTFSCRILLIAAFAGSIYGSALQAANPPESVLSLTEATKKDVLHTELSGNGRDQLKLVITNRGVSPVKISLPAGMICAGENGNRVITLRASTLSLDANSTAEADIPAAALSLTNTFGTQPFTVSDATEPELTEILKLLASRDDVPRTTAQLAILALLENVTFAQWQHFSAVQRSPQSPPYADLIAGIDAIGLLKETAPNGDFTLAQDNELKLRALRNPVCRAKAVQLYGLGMSDNSDAAPQGVPDLKQLLHTQPGDNCPICKMRQRAARGAGDL